MNGTFDLPIKISVRSWLSRLAEEKRTQVVWAENVIIHSAPPIALLESSGEKTVLVPFAGDCGVDNICQSHVVLTCHFTGLKKDPVTG